MASKAGKSDYVQAFTLRVYSAREHAQLSQEGIAHVLGTNQTAYSKYETRSLMPHSMIRSFCMTCRVGVEWLITGQGKGGVPLRDKPLPEKRRGRKKKQKAA